jgi:hypothetical protein
MEIKNARGHRSIQKTFFCVQYPLPVCITGQMEIENAGSYLFSALENKWKRDRITGPLT